MNNDDIQRLGIVRFKASAINSAVMNANNIYYTYFTMNLPKRIESYGSI
jgi:hypothetical protein